MDFKRVNFMAYKLHIFLIFKESTVCLSQHIHTQIINEQMNAEQA